MREIVIFTSLLYLHTLVAIRDVFICIGCVNIIYNTDYVLGILHCPPVNRVVMEGNLLFLLGILL